MTPASVSILDEANGSWSRMVQEIEERRKNAMRKTVHLCLSSHDEVMYRSEADLIVGFNCFAVAVLSTESRALAEGFLSTHHHGMVQSDSPKELMFRDRNAYSRYFNAKYKRKGRLGEKYYFLLEVEGLYHLQAALDYVNRQGLHHGLAATPFDYPHGSANCFFKKELGKEKAPELMPPSKRCRYLPSNIRIPAQYRMDRSGLLLREDILDTAYVEEVYVSPRNFLFHMNRGCDDERDTQAQKKENDTPPITLETIETNVPDYEPEWTRTLEQGKVNHRRMSDIELCQLIDGKLLPKIFGKPEEASVYALTRSQRIKLYDWLLQKNRLSMNRQKEPLLNGRFFTEAQLGRCLCMNYSATE